MMFRISAVAALSLLASSTAYASGSMTGTTKDEMVPSSKNKKTSSSYGFKIENFVSYDKRDLKASKKVKSKWSKKWSKKKKDGPPPPPPGPDTPTNAPTGRPTKSPTDMPTGRPTNAPTKSPTNAPTRRPTRAPTNSPTNRVTSAVIFVCSEMCGAVAADITQPDFINALGPNGEATIVGGTACGQVCNPGTGRRLQTAGTGANQVTILNLVSFTLDEQELLELCQKNLPGTSSLTTPPSFPPTETPTSAPTNAPTKAPTKAPTMSPTGSPTRSPTRRPTNAPTNSPTFAPTDAPTSAPINPGSINVQCYPEKKLKPFDFNQEFLPMALSGGGGSETGYLNWSFNRGLSAITVGSYNSTSINPATVYSILASGQGGPEGNYDGFIVTAARYNEDSTKEDLGVRYNSYSSGVQNTQIGEVTTVTMIPPYKFDSTTQSYEPDTKDLEIIPFLVGGANGNVYQCTIEPYRLNSIDLDAKCDQIYSLGGGENGITGNIAEMLYIPQINAVVIMTFMGALWSYSISFDGPIPKLTYKNQNDKFQNTNPSELYGQGGTTGDVVLPRSLAAVYIDQETTYLYAAGLWADTRVNPELGEGGLYAAPLTIFSMNGTDTSLAITPAGSLLNTYYTYQVLPVPTGIYFLAGGAGVFYVPYKGKDAPNGMLGLEPTIYQAFGVPADSTEDLGVTVTSIAFSANPNNVVVYKDFITGENKYGFEGGALFISFVGDCGLTVDRTIDSCTQTYMANGCLGSISMSDPCTGELSEFVVENVQGPAYTMIADVNMNLLVQNGQGGLSTFSVPYTPGLSGGIELLPNQYYENSCDCTEPKSLLAEILAGVGFLLAIVAIPELLPEAAGAVVTYAGIAVATAGIGTTFAPDANSDRRLI